MADFIMPRLLNPRQPGVASHAAAIWRRLKRPLVPPIHWSGCPGRFRLAGTDVLG